MRIIAVATIKEFWERVREAEAPMRTWVTAVKTAQWPDPPSVKRDFNSADILKDGRVVFDIGGNKYRLVAWVNYSYATLYVRFVGTHKEYDDIDANEV